MQADITPPAKKKKSLNKKDRKAAFGKVVSSESLGVFKKKLTVWFLQWVKVWVRSVSLLPAIQFYRNVKAWQEARLTHIVCRNLLGSNGMIAHSSIKSEEGGWWRS